MQTTSAAGSKPATQKSEWWRAVLGEFPTGVCLVTAHRRGSDPAGMIVGSFVAVSENPPLVGFFAANSSRTLPKLLAHGSLTVSVLSAGQEAFCRAFASGSPDRWAGGDFVHSPSGGLRLTDAVAWFDTVVETTETYGDHTLVVARVTSFGTGSPGTDGPMVFRRAGYGSFAAPHDAYDPRAFMQRLRWADIAEREVAPLARRFGVELTVNSQIGDRVVTLAMVNDDARPFSSERVGASHPWAAPISPVFAAWAPPAKQYAWEEASRHLTGAVDRDLIERQLLGVRRRGYAVAGDAELTRRFLDLVQDPGTTRRSYAEMWARIAESRRSLEGPAGVAWENVAVIQIPVFGSDGEVVLGLYAIAAHGHPRHTPLPSLVDDLLDHAKRVSTAIREENGTASGTA